MPLARPGVDEQRRDWATPVLVAAVLLALGFFMAV
jgi:hypothetical protein